jgi:type II secretory pathway pseudopilin PulG
MLQETARRRYGRISGAGLTGVLAIIVLATAVVPPLAAWSLNRSRVERALADVRSIADYLRRSDDAARAAATTEVVCGSGRLPKSEAAGEAWVRSPTALQDVFGSSRPRDPWGRCYLANIGGRGAGMPVLVLSAGSNGLIDTPIGAPAPYGDDIGTRVW